MQCGMGCCVSLTETSQSHRRKQSLDSGQDITNERYYHGIDMIAMLFYMVRKLPLIVLAAVAGAVISRYYVTHYVTPVYQATSKIYIAGSDTVISLNDLNLGSALSKDYQEIFKISDVHQKVADILGLTYSSSKLAGMVSTNKPGNSHLLYISVKSTDPEEARQLADVYADVVSDYIANKMGMHRPQLLENARKPGSPVSPNVKQTVKDGAVTGGMIVVLLFAILYLLDDRIRSSRDIANAVQLPVLGTIPVQKLERNEKHEPPNRKLLDGNRPHAIINGNVSLDDSAAESVNAICTGISFAGNRLSRIAVTSSAPNEGKTFTALQLSICMASRGKQTVLIDCDLRKSVMQSKYGIQLHGSGAGLAHLLSGQCDLSDAVYATNYPDLFLIPVGQLVKTPLALLSSPDFDQLMKKLTETYDMVIVDTPPMGLVVDAAEIAKRCDGAVLVVESKKTHSRMLKEVVEHLGASEIPVLGCILNKTPVSLWRFGAYCKNDTKKTGILRIIQRIKK